MKKDYTSSPNDIYSRHAKLVYDLKSTSVIHNIDKQKVKSYKIITIKSGKKRLNQAPFYYKNTQQTRVKKNFLGAPGWFSRFQC